MKKCVKCGNEVNDQDRFCMNCGSAEFEVQQEQTTVLSQEFQQSVYNNQEIVASEQTTILQENFQPDTQPVPQQQAYQPYIAQQMQQPVQQPQPFATQPNQQNLYQNMTNPYGQSNPNFQQSFQPQIQPVKKNPLKKVLIGVGCFLLICVILSVLAAVIGSDDTSDDYDSGNDYGVSDSIGSDDSNEKMAYTKGSVVDGYYVNEWAGFKFKITEEWPDTTEAAKGNYENDVTEVGFASVDTFAGKQFVVMFFDMTETYVQYTEEKFLKEIVESSKAAVDIEINASEFYDKVIADETYKCVDFVAENGVALTYCIRVYDDRIITILASSATKTSIDTLFETIEVSNNEASQEIE